MQNPILKTITASNRLSNEILFKSGALSKWRSSTASVLSTRKYSAKPGSEPHVVKSPHPDIVVPNENLATYVWRDLQTYRDMTAAICGVTGRSYTYSRLRDISAATGVRLLTVLKLSPGDTVALVAPNIPEFPAVMMGAVEAGMVLTTVNPLYMAEEISRQLMNSGAKCVFTADESLAVVSEAVASLPAKIPIVMITTESGRSCPQGVINFNEFSDPKNADFSVLDKALANQSPNDICAMPYSSGTTGMPKGVELTHNNLTSNSEMLKAGEIPLITPASASYQDVVPCILPMFHIYGLVVNMASKLHLGCKLVTLPKFAPDTFLKSQADHKGTILHLVPPIVLFLSAHPSVEPHHLDCVRVVMSGAAPLAASDVERFKERAAHVDFMQGFGMTETSPVVLFGDRKSENYASVGQPTPNTDCKIVSLETGENLGPDEVGELYVRGPQVMRGYHNNPEATKDVFKGDGWLCTGDLAYYDENESFYITDRLKELIKVKGFQVPPAELEGILRTHPSVADAAVIGVPHPLSGEVPRAFVVARPGATVIPTDIEEFVSKRVAAYKRLSGGVHILPAIPKNAAGKIMRKELKAKHGQ